MTSSVPEALTRALPIVAFLLSVTAVAEMCDRVGVFDVAATRLAHWGRHRLWLLWVLFAAFSVLCTIFLSLDTTAVLLTPVGLAVANQIGVSPRPFALTTLWIANTGSLLLPVSNLTNLLALNRFAALRVDHLGYLRLVAVPAAVSIVVTLLVICALEWRVLRTHYAVEPPQAPHDLALLRLGTGVCLVIGPAFAAGVAPWAVSLLAAVILLVALRLRAPELLHEVKLPWAMALGFTLLTVVVTVGHAVGGLSWLQALVGHGDHLGALLRVTAVAAVLSNIVNNLPAYLSVEPMASTSPARLLAALIGTNAGPLVTPWASLATLLWLQRCSAAGVTWRLHRLALGGLLCAGLVCTLAVLAMTALGPAGG